MTWNLNSCSMRRTNVTWLVYFRVLWFCSLCKAEGKMRGVLLKACVYTSASVSRAPFCNSGGFGAGLSWMSSLRGYHFTFRTVVCLASKLDYLTKYESYFKWSCIFSSSLMEAPVGMGGSTRQQCHMGSTCSTGL